MRLAVVGMVVALSAGCRMPLTHSGAGSCDAPGCGPSKCKQAPPCKPEERKEKPGPPPPEKEGPPPTREAIVTQDILLLPRMVYVPYAPQVPTAPARLGTTVPGGRALCAPAEDTTPKAAPPKDEPKTRDAQVCDALDKTLQKLDELNRRLSDLEAKTQCLPGPAMCPAPGPAMCPAPGPGPALCPAPCPAPGWTPLRRLP
jgi:hypothetical protein